MNTVFRWIKKYSIFDGIQIFHFGIQYIIFPKNKVFENLERKKRLCEGLQRQTWTSNTMTKSSKKLKHFNDGIWRFDIKIGDKIIERLCRSMGLNVQVIGNIASTKWRDSTSHTIARWVNENGALITWMYREFMKKVICIGCYVVERSCGCKRPSSRSF